MFNLFKKKSKNIKKEEIKNTSYLSDKSFEKVLIKFIEKIEHHNTVDEKLKYKILHASSLWNKEAVVEDMIRKIKVFKDYDEEEVNFPYRYYLKVLLDKK
ncbi:MAG TPA: hypothetical protein VMZ91_13050 [Candidatus Paceibacterota bacterium]|nr:hypothetical protein [Candidatus Paceibacterota bacterium]